MCFVCVPNRNVNKHTNTHTHTHTHTRPESNTQEYYCHINNKQEKEWLYVNRKLVLIESPIHSAALIQSFMVTRFSVTFIISRWMRWSNATYCLLESLDIKRSRFPHVILSAFTWKHWIKSRNTSAREQAIPVKKKKNLIFSWNISVFLLLPESSLRELLIV